MERTLAPLYGLLLAGGHSRRMGADKAAQTYDGREQLARAYEQLSGVTGRAFVAISRAQIDDPLRRRYPCLVDQVEDGGPAAALGAAFRRHPGSAFLVLACDLPLLDDEVLRTLVRARHPVYEAVAFTRDDDGLPEPLCAVYEPQLVARVAIGLSAGRLSLRRSLMDATLSRLPPPTGLALANVNTPEERDAALRTLGPRG